MTYDVIDQFGNISLCNVAEAIAVDYVNVENEKINDYNFKVIQNTIIGHTMVDDRVFSSVPSRVYLRNMESLSHEQPMQFDDSL